jgi:hypothetical protein
VLRTLVDADIPASIARDTEVTAAIAAHEAAPDPHPGYTTAAELAAGISALNLASGTYTPTATTVTNLDSATAFLCQYLRVGSVVTVSGRVDVDPTAATTLSTVALSLPIASNFGGTQDACGVAYSTTAVQGGAIASDSANDRVNLWFTSIGTASVDLFFTFTYRVI